MLLNRRRFLIASFSVVSLSVSTAVSTTPSGAKSATCAICGMDIQLPFKAAFETIHEEKPIHFCSLACAMRFHDKHKDASILGYDFNTARKLDTKNAFFLVKSSKILKEIEFGMPPSVVVFSSRDAATKARDRLGDGQIVQGFDKATAIFR